MLAWFRKKKEVSLAGRTASEWYWLHRSPQYRRADWADSLAEAVREITAHGHESGWPAHLTDILVTHESEAARCVAAIQLSIDQPAGAEGALIAALQDESELVRRTAAESLVAMGSVKGLAAVVAGARHGRAVRTGAAHKLAKMKTGEAAEAVPALMVLLQYPYINWRTHYAAVDALCAIGDPAIPSLVNALLCGSPQVRKYSASALKEIGKTPELQQLIDEAIRATNAT